MAKREQIILNFEDDIKLHDEISFYRTQDETLFSTQIKTVAVESRTAKNQLPVYNYTGIQGEAGAIAFEKYFDIDFNASGIMQMRRDVNMIIIDIDLGWTFNNFILPGSVTVKILPQVPSTFRLLNATLIPSKTPCSTVIVSVVLSDKADSYRLLGAGGRVLRTVLVGESSFEVEIDRTTQLTLQAIKDGEPIINVSKAKWGVNDFYIQRITYFATDIIVFSNPLLGATFICYAYYPNQLSQKPEMPSPPLEYSLNGVNWQTSNVFNGQVDGTYTMHVRDSLGCEVQKVFTASGIKSGREPFIYISDLNSVGFAESEKWNGDQDGVDKNPENTLAETERYNFEIYDETLVFREEDYVRIQFKSNYDYQVASMESCDGLVMPLNIEKKSNNLDRFEWLDAKMVSYGDGSMTAIYYDSGMTYNEDGTERATFDLNGNVPDLSIIGNYVEIIAQEGGLGGIYKIMDVLYDNNIGKFMLLFQYDCDSVYPVNVTTKSYYDILNYEVYEFKVGFYDYVSMISGGGQEGRLRIRFTDDLYDERNFYSNWIEVVKRKDDYDLEKYFTFHYQNNNNRSIFYQYGIIHFFRAEVDYSHAIIEDTVDAVKGDSSSYLSESTVHHGISIKFADCSYKVLMKLVLAVSSETLFVNGLGYIKNGPVESKPVENTNLYSLTVTLLRNTQNFNTFVNSNTGLSEGYTNVYIPRLIVTDLGNNIKA